MSRSPRSCSSGNAARPTSTQSCCSVIALNPGRGLHEQAERQRRRSTRGRLLQPRHASVARCSATTRAPRSTALPARSRSPHAATPSTTRRSPSIGVAYNGSPESDAALAVARELAAPTRARRFTRWKSSRCRRSPTAGIVAPAIGECIDEMRQGSKRAHERARRRRRARRVRPRRRGARRVRRRAGPPRGRLARLRPATTSGHAAAPPTTWSATRAARCSCCPARTHCPQPSGRPRAPASSRTRRLAQLRRRRRSRYRHGQ